MKLSVAVITRNEQSHIRACLKSVQWADEIVVVDQHSTDETADIAARMGATVYIESWKGFSAQKNSAIDRTHGQWVLSLDADERVTPELGREILRVVEKNGPEDGFCIKRKNHFCGRWIRHGGWWPDYTLRLFKRDKGRFQERRVHESVHVNGKVGRLSHPMAHFTYTSVTDFLTRMDTYSRLASKEITLADNWTRWVHLLFRPGFNFFQMYILRLGFLDGMEGLFLAVSYSYYTFLKYYRYYRDSR